MNWFGEQIQSRTRKDRENVSDVLLQVADSIDGKKRFHAKKSSTEILQSEVGRICHYFELEIPEEIPFGDTVNDLIDYLVRPSGILRRRVLLESGWWKKADGPLPPEPMTGGSLITFLMKNISLFDIVFIIAAIFLITLYSAVTPLVTRIVFAGIILSRKYKLVISTAMLLLSVA